MRLATPIVEHGHVKEPVWLWVRKWGGIDPLTGAVECIDDGLKPSVQLCLVFDDQKVGAAIGGAVWGIFRWVWWADGRLQRGLKDRCGHGGENRSNRTPVWSQWHNQWSHACCC